MRQKEDTVDLSKWAKIEMSKMYLMGQRHISLTRTVCPCHRRGGR